MESVHFVLIKYLSSLLARFRLFAYLRLTEKILPKKYRSNCKKSSNVSNLCTFPLA